MIVIENMLEIISFIIFLYLIFFIYKNIQFFKSFSRELEFAMICDSLRFLYIKGGNITIETKETIVANENLLKMSSYSCRIPKVCEHFSGSGWILIKKEQNCLKFEVIE